MKIKTTKLGEVLLVRRGTTITRKQTTNGDIPVIGGGTKPTYFHNQQNREANCITISGSGANAGLVNIWKKPIFASDCSTVEAKDDTQLSKFVYYFLKSQQNYIYDNFRSGAAQPHVYAKDIEKLDFPIVSIPNQKIIINKLDTVFENIDRVIELINNNIENSKLYYSHAIDNAFFKYISHTKSIGDYSKINYGYTSKASFNNGAYKLLRITDIQNNSVDWNMVPYCDVDSKKLSNVLLHDGDIVFARTGATTGKSFLIKNPNKTVFASYLIRVSVNREKILPEYVMHYFQSADYWRQINDGISGSTQGGFNATKLGKLKIPIINKTEQKKLIDKLDTIYGESKNLENFYFKKKQLLLSLKTVILRDNFQFKQVA